MAKHYKLKMEDKAALLNHLQALNINIDSFDITDNNLTQFTATIKKYLGTTFKYFMKRLAFF
jgi:hypothetical protein